MADQKRGNDKPPPKPDTKNNGAKSRNGNDNTPSLATRIQSSASGLARNAFLSSVPSGNTAQLLSDGSKAAPSSSLSAIAAAEQYRDPSGPSSSSNSRDQARNAPAEAFRSPSTTMQPAGGFELPALTEDEFQTTYGGDLSETVIADTGISKGKGKSRETSAESQLSNAPPPHAQSTATILPTDGAAVISLLSDPTFDPDFPPSAAEPPEYLETELSPPAQLTPSETQILESFRRQVPVPPEQHTPQNPQRLTSLSLIPDIGSFLDTVPAANEATALRDTVLTSLPGAADWIAVEEKYHDEVWGYLRPALEAAREEIEARKESHSSGPEEGPAVRRLRMILKHMQGDK